MIVYSMPAQNVCSKVHLNFPDDVQSDMAMIVCRFDVMSYNFVYQNKEWGNTYAYSLVARPIHQ